MAQESTARKLEVQEQLLRGPLDAVVARIAPDARQEPGRYLQESIVPGGGE